MLFRSYKEQTFDNDINDNNNNDNNDKRDKYNLFYDWLMENTDYITDIELLHKTYNMFTLSCLQEKLDIFKNIKIINGPLKQEVIQSIMEEEDFIFCAN